MNGPSMKHLWSMLAVPLLLVASCGGDNSTRPLEDTTPPSIVNNLAVERTAPGSVTLRWTAPGDDQNTGTAARYDIRYSPDSIITRADWDSARLASPLPTPKPAGSLESYTVSPLRAGTWYFRLRAADEAQNLGGLSNMVSASVSGVAAFLRVTDVAVVAAGPGSITLTWTAPGIEGTPVKSVEYDLRYASATITDATWNDAVRVSSLPEPASRGTRESFTITGLAAATTYFFALKAADNEGEWSGLSNIVQETTTSTSYERLTTSSRPAGVGNSTWSPDGESIVFAADWTEQYRFALYRKPVSGGASVKLTNDPGTVYGPAWSSDGNKLAFVSSRLEDLSLVYRLSIMDATPGALPTVVVSYADQSIGVPSWSPDGTRLAYAVTISFPPQVTEIYTVSAAGGTPVRLTNAAVNGTQPAWSPDGTRIAFSSNLAPYGIRVMPATGGDAIQLTSGSATEGGQAPAWSPDGTRIAFSSDRAGSNDIWVIQSTGGDPTRLTFSSDREFLPSWAPDGRAICVTRTIGSGRDGIADLWVLRL